MDFIRFSCTDALASKMIKQSDIEEYQYGLLTFDEDRSLHYFTTSTDFLESFKLLLVSNSIESTRVSGYEIYQRSPVHDLPVPGTRTYTTMGEAGMFPLGS